MSHAPGKHRDFETLRRHGLALPEASESFPWGHTALKVKNKTFVWLDQSDGILSLTVKLPVSRDFACEFEFAEPGGYGLAGAGWISCRFPPGAKPDLDLMKHWIEESYRAVAPKSLAKQVVEAG